MIEAIIAGVIGAGTLLVGAVIAVVRPPSPRVLGAIMAFGAGVLMSAVAFELVEKAASLEEGIRWETIGLFAGWAAFAVGDLLVTRRMTRSDPLAGEPQDAHAQSGGLSIFLGALLDGIPECAVLGLTIVTGGHVGPSMLVAVAVSNLPEGIAATAGLVDSGWSRARIYRLWIATVIACTLSSVAGYVLLDDASNSLVAFTLAFAGGAILTMIATTLMPQAYRLAGRAVGFVTVLGFSVAFAIDWIAG